MKGEKKATKPDIQMLFRVSLVYRSEITAYK